MTATVKPTTARLDALLSTVAVKKEEAVLNGQAVVWMYFLADRRTVNVVVSRRGGRVVRAFTTDPFGPVVKFTGTATDVVRQVKEYALAA